MGEVVSTLSDLIKYGVYPPSRSLSIPLVGCLGNSIEGNNSNFQNAAAPGTSSFLYGAGGYLVWACILASQRCKLPKNYIFGYVSKTVGEFANLGLASVLALNPMPSVVTVGCATNSVVRTDGQQTFDAIVNGVTIGGTFYPGYSQIINALTGIGCRVIIRPTGPRSDIVLTAAQVETMLRVNRWLWQVSRLTPRVYVPDYIRDLVDPTSTLFGPKSAILNLSDNLHPNLRGAYYMGKGFANILNSFFPTVDVLAPNAAVYSASSPYGNLVPNPQFAGTSGTLTNAVGTAPTSWTLTKLPVGDSSLTVTGSSEASGVDPNFTAAKIALSGSFTPAGSGSVPDVSHLSRLQINVSQANLSVNDIVEGYVGVEVSADIAGVACPSLVFRDSGNTRFNHAMYPGNGGELPAEAWSGVLYTGEFTVLDVSAAPFFMPHVIGKGDVSTSVTAGGSVKFRRPSLWKKMP